MDYCRHQFRESSTLAPRCSIAQQSFFDDASEASLDLGNSNKNMQQHNTSNIDPTLENSPLFSPNWTVQPQQVQRYLDDPQKTAFFNASPLPQTHCQNPRTGSVAHSVSGLSTPQPSYASPYSTNEHSSSCGSLLSPPGESELHYEGPPTPSGIDMIMPFTSASLKQPFTSWATDTTDLGNCPTMPAFTNPFAVNPADDLTAGFMDDSDAPNYGYRHPNHLLPPSAYILQSNISSGYGVSATNAPRVLDFETNVLQVSDAVQPMNSYGEDYYPSPSAQDEEMGSELDVSVIKPDPDTIPVPREAPRQKRNSSTPSSAKRKQKSAALQRPENAVGIDSSPKRRRLSVPNVPQQRRRSDHQAAVATPKMHLAPPISSRGTTSSPQPAKPTKDITCAECKSLTFKSEAALQTHIKKQHTRPFVCIFAFAGCDANFPSKNEWKRHVLSQHLLLHYWICTQDTCAHTDNNGVAASAAPASGRSSSHRTPSANAPRVGSLRGRNSCAIAPAASSMTPGLQRFGPPLPNGAIFNRKDLFTQHVRRMHMPQAVREQQKVAGEQQSGSSGGSKKASSADKASGGEQLAGWEKHVKNLQQAAQKERCRLPISMACPVESCEDQFIGVDAWDSRMEHLARHFEAAGKGEEPPVPSTGEADPTLVQWASDENVAVVVKCGTQWVLNNPLKPTDIAVMAAAANKLAAARGNAGEEDAEGEFED
ncbi:hypothetical protein MCOR27_010684 [Pyricularia oryzae]|uniref:C2H2-type domain-containing protein n=1 Tax=Pyricularia grisea TaxID=148305 RepID=A0ABQ8N5E9_PYRGI|nr:hypothetical protein MCOR01_009093 [Pyricularia oryzae]KAI6291555.1 hypothetical protein MCOR33_010525 [Pyricularia grisea]KAH9439784.1 hypothetical protein MCOR02_003322 [Pyricularia oryzae]KAI6267215.1 hypothetical protein MCOR27_010684 [Pyricularia oryzae]KAI6267331.1 hypothetical protein MCOR26_009749 [Pyricularia oryzae]